RLKVFTNASDIPLDSGLFTGVKQGTRFSAVAKSRVSLAVYGLPLSDKCSTGCGARVELKRFSTASSIMWDCQEFCARGHDDGKERIITWLSRENFWTNC